MKNRIVRMAVLAFGLLGLSCQASEESLSVDKKGRTVVERFGKLQVSGAQLLNDEGRPVQLRGISSSGLQYAGKWANEGAIRWLRDDFNIQVWRAALYLTEGGYIQQPSLKLKVVDSVEAAIKLGIYVIIDWHVLGDKDPRLYQRQSIEFFREMAQKYHNYPNVIYEICSEPNGYRTTWEGAIKPYAEVLVSEIRTWDADNIIIVGTPTWSQDVDIVAVNPLQGYENIMYAFHFYAGNHGEEFRKKAKTAIDMGLPIFVSECGTSQSSGGGGVFEKEYLEWLSFLKKHQISWLYWSLTNKGEDSGLLVLNADREGKGGWTDKELSQSGKLIRKILRNEIKVK